MSEIPNLPFGAARWQMDFDWVFNRTTVSIYANQDSIPRQSFQMELTRDEARLLKGEIENAMHIITEARKAKADKETTNVRDNGSE